jgi:hypothetical protein
MADLIDLIQLVVTRLLPEIRRLRLLLLLPRLQLPLPSRRIRFQVPVSGHGMKSE